MCQTIFYFLFSEFPRVSTSFKQHFNNKFTTFLFYIFFTPTTFHANETKKLRSYGTFKKKKKKSRCQSQGVRTLFYFKIFEFLKVSTSFWQHFNNIVTTFLFYIFFKPWVLVWVFFSFSLFGNSLFFFSLGLNWDGRYQKGYFWPFVTYYLHLLTYSGKQGLKMMPLMNLGRHEI